MNNILQSNTLYDCQIKGVQLGFQLTNSSFVLLTRVQLYHSLTWRSDGLCLKIGLNRVAFSTIAGSPSASGLGRSSRRPYERVVPCGLTCWKDDCNWRRRCDLKVLECLTIPESSVSGGICAERGLLGVTTCATMLEERVRSYANQQNQDSLQLYTTNHLYCPSLSGTPVSIGKALDHLQVLFYVYQLPHA
ncbi:unnamed protein product [Brassica rapa]|uniref:Uncharacterized protein n=1 Tax=Brassica campestris TaxID=3711 RepID=A0A8D9GRK4_BRACM|nr:unnamed protein product [Brassica rapa]